jgi:ankyrin repeat protein
VPTSDEQATAVAVVASIRGGDLAGLRRLLDEQPAIATGRFRGRTALHVVTDWPGYYPDGPATVRLLIAAGADPNARTEGHAPETPLHWAASSDDVDVADALIDGGADVEAAGGSIGTPLDNAVGYGCWHVARRLVERGARVDKPWQAAALGLMTRVEQLLAAGPEPAQLNEAFWHACRGGQRRVAEYLLRKGADIDATVEYAHGTPLDVAPGPDTRRDLLTTWLREQGAQPSRRDTAAGPESGAA